MAYTPIKLPRGIRSAWEALRSASGLGEGQIAYLTDEGQLVLGKGTNVSVDLGGGLATQAEAVAGTSATRTMSPLRTDQLLASKTRLSAVQPLSYLTANVSAANGQRYWMSTAAAARTVTLPAAPVSGDTIEVVRLGANNVTIARNGKTIAGLSEDLNIDTDMTGVTLVYVNGDKQWL